MKTTILLLALILVAGNGCTSGLSQDPSEATKTPRSTGTSSPDSQPLPEEDGEEDADEPAVAMAKAPWMPGDMQYGLQLYWHIGTLKPSEVEGRISQMLDYVVGLGANSLGITFPIYTDGPRPRRVYAGRETPKPQVIGKVISGARERGLFVMVRPIIDEENIMTETGQWRGTLQPSNVRQWFMSYRRAIMPFLKSATQAGAQEFVLGTELYSLQDKTAEWQALKQASQSVFNGRLSYGVNWDGFDRQVPFRHLGVDLYPVVDLGDDASIARLADALSSWLTQQPLSVRRRLSVHEVGIAALSGVYRQPWLWGSSSDNLNLEVQRKWFVAACQAVRRSKLQGIYYWMLDSNYDLPNTDPSTQPAFMFYGRPAEKSMEQCFRKFSQ